MAWQAYLANPLRPDGTAGVRVSVWYYDDTDAANAGAGLGPQGSGTATASTNLINIAGHGLQAGHMIVITSITGGAPLAANSDPYFVVATGLTANAFAVSKTPGGTAIDITANATALTARKVTPPAVLLHQQAWTLPHGSSINDLLPQIDREGQDARESYVQAAAIGADIPVGTTRTVP